MDQLVKLVAQKTGIPEDKAKIAVDTVINFIKERLPDPIAKQVQGIIDNPNASNLTQGLGGLLGKK